MANRKDFAISEDNDLVFKNGDILIQESDQQHIIDTCNAVVGWWKEFPLDGVNINYFVRSTAGGQQMARKIKIELEKDGYKVNNPVVEFLENGNLTIYPNATRI